MPACMVQGCCNSTGRSHGVSFHRFPPDGPLFQQWLAALKRTNFQPQKHHVVCSQHFRPWDFKDDLRSRLLGACAAAGDNWRRRRLKPEAVPTMFLSGKPAGTAKAQRPAKKEARTSRKVSVTFSDVAACVSEEEWEILDDWERDLYRNVMREIHMVLISLGYTIVNPNVLLRIKPGEALNFRDPVDFEGTVGMRSPGQGYQTVHPHILLKIQDVQAMEEPRRRNHQGMEEQASITPPLLCETSTYINPSTGHLGYEISNEDVSNADEEPGTTAGGIYAALPVNQVIVAPTIKQETEAEESTYTRGCGSQKHSNTDHVTVSPNIKQELEDTRCTGVCGSSPGTDPSTGQVIMKRTIKQEEEDELYRGACGNSSGTRSQEDPSTGHAIVNCSIKQETEEEEKMYMGMYGRPPGTQSHEDPSAVGVMIDPVHPGICSEGFRSLKKEEATMRECAQAWYGLERGQMVPTATYGAADAQTLRVFLVNQAQETYFWSEQDFRQGDDGHHSCTTGRQLTAGKPEAWASRSRRKSAHLILKHPSLSGSKELLPE
ncbi:uncharacterized protein LOC115466437 [Microcaecilia unicolor]|uniref:Uncharacterized protein LOC115466437 n=1 Tax=Microcaecilia unicolor TaxID=1415580 RepID=A0A6P7XSU8_9AMPH|nr:uncharacterized protein LOC115466437 [Microcaecilia unicolor]